MASTRRGRKRAGWAGEGVVDLTDNPAAAAGLLTIQECAKRVGRAVTSLYDLLVRRPVTNPAAPEFALTRPYAAVGTVPYYSPDQCDRYHELKSAGGPRNSAATGDLPLVSAEDAEEQGLATPAQLADRHKIAQETLARWATWYLDFPPPVAELVRPGVRGRRPLLRSHDAVTTWLQQHNETAA